MCSSKLRLLALLSVFVVMALGCGKKKKSKSWPTGDIMPPVTTANPPGGKHNSAVSVTLTSNESATIYYTTDGSTPTTSSQVYSNPIDITQDTTLKFFAVDEAGNQESVKTETYDIDLSADKTPPVTTADPPGGTYDSAVSVTLTSNEPATVYYTADGREPTVSDYDGTGASPLLFISVSVDTVLKFFAVDAAGNVESVKTETYVISATTFGTWGPTTVDSAPLERKEHTAVWTGTEMIAWGGGGFMSNEVYDNGGRYDPVSDTWTPTSTTNVPTARYLHSAVWTGSEMIVWGGLVDAPEPNDVVNTGGRYDPASDAWTATSTTGAPEPRWHHTAVWTGTEMIIWGGMNGDFEALNTGGRYNPASNTWTSTSTTGAPQARNSHTAVWTGTEMLIWGGTTPSGNGASFDTGGRYNPSTNTWTPTSTTDAAEARHWHTAVWTGTEMIVWGGFDNSVEIIDTGGRYDPAANTWTPTSTTDVPLPRCRHTAVWTGTEMIVWGGGEPWVFAYNTGGLYDPATDTWMGTSTDLAPSEREIHTAVWASGLASPVMIIWGGTSGSAMPVLLNTGGCYMPPAD